MTSVRNLRLPLSGNNLRLLLLLAIFWGASCSPKVRPVVSHPQPVVPPAKTLEKPVNKPQPKLAPPVQKFSSIAMLMPLNLDELNSARGYSHSDLKKANMGVEYYQGFKMALDSLTANGYNYRVQLFDSKDQPAESRNLALNPKLRNSDLIVGPIFPDGIKAFTTGFAGVHKPILSPLSPASPATFRNASLITIIPPLNYHAQRAAQYVNDRLKAKKVIILKSGFSEDNKYIIPFKQGIDSLSRLRTKVIPFVVVRGNLTALLPQLSKTEANVFVLPSVNQAFLQVTLRSLDTLSKHYPIVLIGHPSWENFKFLRPEQLQRLKAVITSSDHVNYKNGSTITFIKNYRRLYHVEPTEFAIKGFDEGLYFGQLLAENEDETIRPEQHNFEGLHNNFHFIKKPNVGWINTHVYILRYINFELKAIE